MVKLHKSGVIFSICLEPVWLMICVGCYSFKVWFRVCFGSSCLVHALTVVRFHKVAYPLAYGLTVNMLFSEGDNIARVNLWSFGQYYCFL